MTWQPNRECICIDWSENIDQVTAFQRIMYARNPVPSNEYHGKKFKYCPWCGSELIKADYPIPSETTIEVK